MSTLLNDGPPLDRLVICLERPTKNGRNHLTRTPTSTARFPTYSLNTSCIGNVEHTEVATTARRVSA